MTQANVQSEVVIEAYSRWQLPDFGELFRHRDLVMFLVKRDIKVMYAQTILGFLWAILNPVIQIVVFSLIFGRLAQLDSDGHPYVLFSAVAIIPWNYMSAAMGSASQSLVSGQAMLGKIYFPRMIFPLTPVISGLVDFAISSVILVAIMLWFDVSPSLQLLWLPVFIVMMAAVPLAIGLWFSSLAIRYRDVRFAMGFVIRMLIYSAPILYAASLIPDSYRFWYSLNPIVGVIEGFRASLLGTPIPWEFILPGMLGTVVLLFAGAIYFRRMERIVVDVI